MMLKLKDTPERKIYFTSDLHLGHKKDFVWKTRGYESVEAHDTGIIDTINSIVRPSDVLLFLGDFCLNTPIKQFEEYLTRVQCQNIWALWGNHNNPHEKQVYREMQFEGTETYPSSYLNMVFMGYYLEATLNGHYAVLCHFPIYIWNHMFHGAWMLCGHSHGGCPLTIKDNIEGKMLDVGWDEHKKPLSIDEISEIMNKKQIVYRDRNHIIREEQGK